MSNVNKTLTVLGCFIQFVRQHAEFRRKLESMSATGMFGALATVFSEGQLNGVDNFLLRRFFLANCRAASKAFSRGNLNSKYSAGS